MQERKRLSRERREQEQRLAQEKQQKRKQTLGKLGLAAKIVLSVVVVMSLLFVAAQSLGNVTFGKATDYINQSISNLKPGPGYPLEVGTGKVLDMKRVGDCVALLESDGLLLLNSTAKEIARYPHTYSRPLLSVNNGKILLCDRATGRYTVASRSDVIETGELKTEVFCSTIGKNGCYAFATASKDSASLVSIYNSNNEKMFDFKCADEYIIGLSFSPNGSSIAVVGIGSKKAVSYSKMYIIGIDSKKVDAQFEFGSKTVNNVFYSGKRSVVTLSENSLSIISDNKEKSESDFGFNTISRFAPHESGSFAVVLSKYGSLDSGTAALLDSMGSELFSIETDSKIECLDFDGKTVCILDANDTVSTYNKSGELIGETKLDVSAQRIAVCGKYCYALCYGSLIRVDVQTPVESESTSAK